MGGTLWWAIRRSIKVSGILQTIFFSFEKPPTEFVLVEGFLVVVGKPMSGHFGAVLALCWANVGPMLDYVGPFGSMLGLCWGLW